ncbi:ACP S-malonyltransferase [Actinacidiphila alni]|uniref:Malonyl CoA-acyl carrier protein transacylase n=1 Tax=Actinacidiphila alni TaxID=380248 RepID=A0A1I2J4I3_9ACTN|nr:ACP S-malonyltransferase [Actinacidiphila alni]SFF48773.1 [acyl-carrier-protein] S-malonyltransferase [Actinacidiphila alni]
MDRIGFVFPGQGSQKVGMGLDLAGEHPDLVGPYYRTADEILGLPLSRLCWEGPAEALRDTSVTQPAIFLTSLCTWQALRPRGLAPDVVAGHSLGEYTALVAAGVLDWTDALRLVRLRGTLMAAVNERVPGAMAAILGLPLEDVEGICAQAATGTGQIVEIANDNEPAQVVVSGQEEAVQWVMAAAKDAGARRAVALEVGAPFHCSLMSGIEDEFAAALDAVEFRDPSVEIISSVTAAPVTTADEARTVLKRQLTGRVRWTDTVLRMSDAGVGRFIEIGPGKVLGGLCRRIVPGTQVYATFDSRQCASTLDALAFAAGG